jgi:hypothetical protein
MSLVDDTKTSLDPNLIRWGGYGLAVVGVAAVVYAWMRPGMLSSALALVLALAPVGIGAAYPQLFEVNYRGGRGFNPIVGFAALVLLLLAFSVHLVDERPAWIAAFVVGAGLGAATWAAAQAPGLASPIQALLTVAVIGGIYGYGAYAMADVRFDPSPGTAYQAAISDKQLTHGRHNSTGYHLSLPPWGPVTAASSVSVPKSVYDALQPGDTICLTLHPGAMGDGWYDVGLCGAPGPA